LILLSRGQRILIFKYTKINEIHTFRLIVIAPSGACIIPAGGGGIGAGGGNL